MESLKRLSQYLASRPAQLRELKDQGVKIVGYFPGDYVPEEIIYASGAVPLCLSHGGDPMVVRAAQSATMRFQCAFSKAQLGERLLKERPYYSLPDLLVAPMTCAHLRKAADQWQYYGNIAVFRLGVPHEYDTEYGLEYYIGALKRLKQRLESVTGQEIEDKRLEEAIELYNRMRTLLKEISLMRKAPRPPISTLDFFRLNHASFYADPTFMVEVLTALQRELREKTEDVAGPDRPRILLTGPNVAFGDYKVLELAEEAGGLVVAEEVGEGVRYYWENVESGTDLLVALANRYLRKRTPCAFMNASSRKRLDFIMKLVRDFDVDGVIWYQLLYCETYDIESHFFVKNMEEARVPVLKLQSDYDVLDLGPLRTRIEAFVEMLGGRAES